MYDLPHEKKITYKKSGIIKIIIIDKQHIFSVTLNLINFNFKLTKDIEKRMSHE